MAKNPVPKKIAGVKIPKRIRKSKLLRKALKSPMGWEILVEAVTAGAAAGAAALVRHPQDTTRASMSGTRPGLTGAEAIACAAREATDAVLDVVANALRSVSPDARRGAQEED